MNIKYRHLHYFKGNLSEGGSWNKNVENVSICRIHLVVSSVSMQKYWVAGGCVCVGVSVGWGDLLILD